MRGSKLNEVKIVSGKLRGMILLLAILLFSTTGMSQSSSEREPEARNKAAICYDSQRGRLVMFGGAVGFGRSRRVAGDTWEWDSKSRVQVK